MRTTTVVVLAVLASFGCASFIGSFERASSPSDYCNSAASYAKFVFAEDYRDKMGLNEESARKAVEFQTAEMTRKEREKALSSKEELKDIFKAINKERKAKLEAVRITYVKPYRSPENVRLQVRDSCLAGWGKDIWFNLHEF